MRSLEEYLKALRDATSPTASLVLSAKRKLEQTSLKFVEHVFPEIEESFRKFVSHLDTEYSRYHLIVAEYFDPRISKRTEKLDDILAELKIDHETLQRNKSGLERILAEDDKGLRF